MEEKQIVVKTTTSDHLANCITKASDVLSNISTLYYNAKPKGRFQENSPTVTSDADIANEKIDNITEKMMSLVGLLAQVARYDNIQLQKSQTKEGEMKEMIHKLTKLIRKQKEIIENSIISNDKQKSITNISTNTEEKYFNKDNNILIIEEKDKLINEKNIEIELLKNKLIKSNNNINNINDKFNKINDESISLNNEFKKLENIEIQKDYELDKLKRVINRSKGVINAQQELIDNMEDNRKQVYDREVKFQKQLLQPKSIDADTAGNNDSDYNNYYHNDIHDNYDSASNSSYNYNYLSKFPGKPPLSPMINRQVESDSDDDDDNNDNNNNNNNNNNNDDDDNNNNIHNNHNNHDDDNYNNESDEEDEGINEGQHDYINDEDEEGCDISYGDNSYERDTNNNYIDVEGGDGGDNNNYDNSNNKYNYNDNNYYEEDIADRSHEEEVEEDSYNGLNEINNGNANCISSDDLKINYEATEETQIHSNNNYNNKKFTLQKINQNSKTLKYMNPSIEGVDDSSCLFDSLEINKNVNDNNNNNNNNNNNQYIDNYNNINVENNNQELINNNNNNIFNVDNVDSSMNNSGISSLGSPNKSIKWTDATCFIEVEDSFSLIQQFYMKDNGDNDDENKTNDSSCISYNSHIYDELNINEINNE
jgi:hypothetical protein